MRAAARTDCARPRGSDSVRHQKSFMKFNLQFNTRNLSFADKAFDLGMPVNLVAGHY
jgi:hypothetical protein